MFLQQLRKLSAQVCSLTLEQWTNNESSRPKMLSTLHAKVPICYDVTRCFTNSWLYSRWLQRLSSIRINYISLYFDQAQNKHSAAALRTWEYSWGDCFSSGWLMILPFTIKNADVINPLCALTSIVIMCGTHSLSPWKTGCGVEKGAVLRHLCLVAQQKYGLLQNEWKLIDVNNALIPSNNDTTVSFHFSGLGVRMSRVKF